MVEISHLDVFGGKEKRIFVICPPPTAVVGPLATMFQNADRKSRQLAPLLRDIAQRRGAGFLDAGEIIRSSPIDGIHLDADAQIALGQAAAAALAAFIAKA